MAALHFNWSFDLGQNSVYFISSGKLFQICGPRDLRLWTAVCTQKLCGRACIAAIIFKDKSGADKIIVKKQPYQLLNTNREFFPSFDASNFNKLVNESSQVGPNIVSILYFVRMCEGAIRRLAM